MHGVWASNHGAQKNRGEEHTRSQVGKSFTKRLYTAIKYEKKCLRYLKQYDNISNCDKFLATLMKSVARDQKEVTIA